jgi:hypothetical protein
MPQHNFTSPIFDKAAHGMRLVRHLLEETRVCLKIFNFESLEARKAFAVHAGCF